MVNCPPNFLQNRCTLCPFSANVTVASKPPGPHPKTAIVLFSFAFSSISSFPTLGFTPHRMGTFSSCLAFIHSLQPTHFLIRLSSPSFTLFTQSGSAMSVLPKITISAWLFKIFSAVSGCLITPTATIGTERGPIFSARSARQASLNCMGSNLYSFGPKPISAWTMAKLFSDNTLAILLPSSILIPPSFLSSTASRTVTGKSKPIFSPILFLISSKNSSLFPHLSFLWLVKGDKNLFGKSPCADWISTISKPAFLAISAEMAYLSRISSIFSSVKSFTSSLEYPSCVNSTEIFAPPACTFFTNSFQSSKNSSESILASYFPWRASGKSMHTFSMIIRPTPPWARLS